MVFRTRTASILSQAHPRRSAWVDRRKALRFAQALSRRELVVPMLHVPLRRTLPLAVPRIPRVGRALLGTALVGLAVAPVR